MKTSVEPIFVGPLAAWLHEPERKAKMRVLLVHGLGEHSGRHLNTVDFLVSQGFEVVRFDLRGAGKSGGERQWVEKFSDYVDDTTRIYNWICSERDPLPLVVLGHSLGGAISIYFSARFANQLRGLALSAPAYLAGDGVSSIKIAVGKMIQRFAPHLRIPGSLDASTISRDPKVVADYVSDPLACHFNTLRQGNEIITAMDQLPKQLPALKLPVALFHGTMDRIIRPEGSFQILEQLPGPDRTLYFLPGGYHEPHNDLDKENYFLLLGQWLIRQQESVKSNTKNLSLRRAQRATRQPIDRNE